jgi:hypothetical protein
MKKSGLRPIPTQPYHKQCSQKHSWVWVVKPSQGLYRRTSHEWRHTDAQAVVRKFKFESSKIEGRQFKFKSSNSKVRKFRLESSNSKFRILKFENSNSKVPKFKSESWSKGSKRQFVHHWSGSVEDEKSKPSFCSRHRSKTNSFTHNALPPPIKNELATSEVVHVCSVTRHFVERSSTKECTHDPPTYPPQKKKSETNANARNVTFFQFYILFYSAQFYIFSIVGTYSSFALP